jgi:pimeloyl-ACP methyl ester carboxylesterase
MTAAGSAQPVPFNLHVGDDVLSDLKTRLARVRWPDAIPGGDWKYGAEVEYLQSLVGYWRDQYDWRRHEAVINGFRQFRLRVRDLDIHYIHEQGKGPAPMPLLISHGWPGSIYEFHKLIPLLTDPAAHGGDARDAFTVIAPSLPGYTFSHVPGRRFALEQIADYFAELMTLLGYPRFAAQGGDWGAFVTSRLGYAHADRVHGIHLNLLAVRRDPKMVENPTADEKVFLAQLEHFLKEETGYQWIQGTKPQTLAFGLTDSPAGLAAWLVEKFHTWTDCRGDLDGYLGRDTMLTDIMLYWVTGAIASSFWPYYARMHGPWPIPGVVQVPTGYIEFPKEILRPPRSVAEKMYCNIRRWTTAERGGHFAALEQPQLLAREIREFFRPMR